MAKVNFSFHIQGQVEDGPEELQKASELSAAKFMELLETSMDQHIQTLREQYPECQFELGPGDDGEEWKT